MATPYQLHKLLYTVIGGMAPKLPTVVRSTLYPVYDDGKDDVAGVLPYKFNNAWILGADYPTTGVGVYGLESMELKDTRIEYFEENPDTSSVGVYELSEIELVRFFMGEYTEPFPETAGVVTYSLESMDLRQRGLISHEAYDKPAAAVAAYSLVSMTLETP
jgi:hypothetical protein